MLLTEFHAEFTSTKSLNAYLSQTFPSYGMGKEIVMFYQGIDLQRSEPLGSPSPSSSSLIEVNTWGL